LSHVQFGAIIRLAGHLEITSSAENSFTHLSLEEHLTSVHFQEESYEREKKKRKKRKTIPETGHARL
jgi:hypothetical protein